MNTANILLFSYGTLQLPYVQQETFGRLLIGTPDQLSKYKLEELVITDTKVLETSKHAIHKIAVFTNNISDAVEGIIFEITAEELEEADRYEVSQYKRIRTQFKSGKQGYVYIANSN